MRSGFHRVKITGLPRSASWQDLKDFMRAGGDVRFTEVETGGMGYAGFSSSTEMERAIRELDDTKFRARNGDSAYVRVKSEFERSRSRSRSRGRRSPSRGRRRSQNRRRSPSGPRRQRSPSRRRSPTPRRPSRSKSRVKGRDVSRSKSRRRSQEAK